MAVRLSDAPRQKQHGSRTANFSLSLARPQRVGFLPSPSTLLLLLLLLLSRCGLEQELGRGEWRVTL